MLLLLLTFSSFLFFLCKSLFLKPLLSWATDISLLPTFFLQEPTLLISHFLKTCKFASDTCITMSFKRKRSMAQVVNIEELEDQPSILDLPELALECILGKLPPSGLCNMAGVCKELRDRCRSDYLWDRHMKEKWRSVLGEAARKDWELYLASSRKLLARCESRRRRWLSALSCIMPISWIRSRMDGGEKEAFGLVPDDSVMSLYLSIECGKFWFPAQVYNREHGHIGFMLSCYDAELSYDFRTDSFHARYPPHGRRTIVLEEGVQWDRIRAPPVDTPAHDLHVSDGLHDLRPGDHIEIQWRRNKEFPYGWWYGVVGHLESCDGNEHFCRCHQSETLVLEFNQYTPGSRWRQALIDRKNHQEEGNENDGFYGGIRKLRNKDEISKWKQLWPTDVLE